MRTRIKICGITDEDSALIAANAGADAVGFVFHRPSPRFIEPADAWDIIGMLPPFVCSVGLFVDASVKQFTDAEEVCPTDLSQLHGDESPTVVAKCGPNVIKAVRYAPDTIEGDLARWGAMPEVDAVLIDGSAGGRGVAFNWQALAELRVRLTAGGGAFAGGKPIIIAGGLTHENVGEVIRSLRPWCVDVSSGVEVDGRPGEKDPAKIEDFCRAVRRADAQAD